MGTNAGVVLGPDDLNDTDRDILDMLQEGRVSPPFVAERLGKSREYTSQRLIRLREHEHARRIAPGLYELVDDPRTDERELSAGPDLDQLARSLDDLEHALERGDRELAADALERARDELGDH